MGGFSSKALRRWAAGLLLAVLLGGCGRVEAPQATAVRLAAVTAATPAALKATPSLTLDAVKAELATRFVGLDLTSTVQARTPSTTVTSSSTPFPPTFTPTPWPPATALAEKGPWLVLEQESSLGRGDDAPTRRYYAADADGTNLRPVGLPEAGEGFTWRLHPDPRGRFLAFTKVHASGFYTTLNVAAGSYEPEIWIVELPENQVVRRIARLGPAGWAQVERERAKLENSDELSLTLGLVTTEMVAWSPDGRYLAFSCATEGTGADLYVYDTEQDAIRRMTTLAGEGARPWFWSPDSRWLVYETGTAYYNSPGDSLWGEKGMWAITMDAGSPPKKLYVPEYEEELVKVTSQGFYVYEHNFESEPRNLRRVSFETGKVEVLYQERFSSVGIDSDGRVLLRFITNASWGNAYDREDGIYQAAMGGFNLRLVMPGNFGCLYWDEAQRAFIVCRDRNEIPYRFNGQHVLKEVPKEMAGIPSPDGRFRARFYVPFGAEEEGIYQLYTAAGKMVTEFGAGHHGVTWLPDSSGLYVLGCEGPCALKRYREDAGWKEERLPINLMWIEREYYLMFRDYWLIVP